MRYKCFVFCVLLFYHAEGKPREVQCPEYCVCDVYNNYRRATCQSRKLVSVEIGMPPEVEVLDLSYNQISQLENEVFSDMDRSDLKHLNLSNNKISQIHMFGFKGLENLKTLDLTFNILEYFLEQWFLNLRNLEELYLQGNNLRLINKQPKINLPMLKVLDLRACRIEHLSHEIFTHLPDLQVLDISSNYFQHLNSETINPLTSLKLLLAEENSLSCREKSVSLLRELLHQRDITYIGPCEKVKNPKIKTRKFEALGSETVTSEKLSALENGKVEEPTDKIIVNASIPENAEIIDDSFIFDDLEKFVNSDKFEKMKLEEKSFTKETPDYEIFDTDNFTDSDSIEIINKLKTIHDSEILKDLKEFIDAKTKEKEENEVAEEKNVWIVDDKEDKKEVLNVTYVEVCNGVRTWVLRNPLDKMIMEVIDMSPSFFMFISALFGLMLGLVIGCTAEIKTIRNMKLPKFNIKRKNKGTCKNMNPEDPNRDSVVEEESEKQEGEPLKSKITCHAINLDGEKSEDETETLRPASRTSRRSSRGSRSPKRPKSPFEDQSLLLDNEQTLEDSTPILGKKKFSGND